MMMYFIIEEILDSFITFFTTSFLYFIKAEVKKGHLLIYSKRLQHEHLFKYNEETDAFLSFIDGLFGLILLYSKLQKIIILILKNKNLAFVFVIYGFISFTTCIMQIYYLKKKYIVDSHQMTLIKTAHESRNIIVAYDAKLWLIGKYCELDEYEMKYCASIELTSFLYNFVCITFIMISNASLINSYLGNAERAASLGCKILELARNYEMIPKEIFKEPNTQIKNEGIFDTKTYDVSYLTYQPHVFKTSILSNFDWNKKLFENKGRLNRHIIKQSFYALLVDVLTGQSFSDHFEEKSFKLKNKHTDNEYLWDINKILRFKAHKLSFGQMKVISLIKTLICPAKKYVLHKPFEGIDMKYHERIAKILENYNVEIIN
ncbi:hypothetical protein EHP00_1525 [Ecytonucleospora hepatopenaei]|uniref:Uncharacterized protein n=1 Tax=Ecytonucleospora hepatopenaei TaxID=646526 RepID=A0A1W0E3S6_9MICR|nr:hypothetical protein EHP00_1525 [Ecytonucleospora hepatopenaei]